MQKNVGIKAKIRSFGGGAPCNSGSWRQNAWTFFKKNSYFYKFFPEKISNFYPLRAQIIGPPGSFRLAKGPGPWGLRYVFCKFDLGFVCNMEKIQKHAYFHSFKLWWKFIQYFCSTFFHNYTTVDAKFVYKIAYA